MTDTLETVVPTGPPAYPAGVAWSAAISEAPLTEALDRSVALYGSNTCVEFLGRNEPLHRQVLVRRPKVLADGRHVAARGA